MARLSGIPDEPEKAPVLLGCHATAADSGESGSGTGVSEYRGRGPVREVSRTGQQREVMRDPEAARRAGLRKFTKRDCAVCHYVKARTSPSPASRRSTWTRPGRCWPTPSRRGRRPTAAPAASAGPVHRLVRLRCLSYHGPKMGYQLPAHESARAGIRRALTPRAAEVAKRRGVTEDPQVSADCLKCHATGGAGGAR